MNSHGALPRFRSLFCRPASHQFAVLTKYICTRELVNSGAAAMWSKQTSDQNVLCVDMSWVMPCTYWSTFLSRYAHTHTLLSYRLRHISSYIMFLCRSHQWSPNATTYYLLPATTTSATPTATPGTKPITTCYPFHTTDCLVTDHLLLTSDCLSVTTSSWDCFLVPTDYLLPYLLAT